MAVDKPNNNRDTAMAIWLQSVFGEAVTCEPITNDASFRRYFRLQHHGERYVVMDAPPDKEPVKPFVAIAKAFKQQGVLVPTVHHEDIDQGFLVLSDCGDRDLQPVLESDPSSADVWYQRAHDGMQIIQTCQPEHFGGWALPHYDDALCEREWHLFWHWHLEKHCQLKLTEAQRAQLADVYALLRANMEAQPVVCVHRDFHCRNLICTPDDQLAVLDFQDAVWGPITYDMVSLLRDAYVDWPVEQVQGWVQSFWEQRPVSCADVDLDIWTRWFDWMGVQRHCKVLGFIARQNGLYGNPRYLAYYPRVLSYLHQMCDRYPELKPLKGILSSGHTPVIPASF